jgi:hypothetical protein
MPDRDETQWKVPGGRSGALKAINLKVRNDSASLDLVVFYPGSGADILHPLFASYARAKYFVFVDILQDLESSLQTAIRSDKVHKLDTEKARALAARLNITSTATAVWKFPFKKVDRYVLLFRAGGEAFLNANGSFRYDLFFDKDFWETSTTHPLKLILFRLRANGFFTTNGSIGAYVPFLADLGLRYLTTVTLNGEQYVYQKVAPTPTDADKTEEAIEAGKKAASTWLFIDPAVWTGDDDGLDALAGACGKARQAIETKMRLAEEYIWPATAIIAAEAFGPDAPLYKRASEQAAQRARTAWPAIVGE